LRTIGADWSKLSAQRLRASPAPAATRATGRGAVLALQASIGNAAVARLLRTPDAATVDDAVEALDLAPAAKAAALALHTAHPEIVFTSGRRDVAEQAHAMASNIVSSHNRKWIEQTYASATALQKWVDDNPAATTVDQLAAGLKGVLDSMSDADRRKVSKHLSGDAFDVQPQTKDAEKIKQDIRALPGLTRFLDHEGGLDRWHAQF
jgi:hypothetical protein